MPGTLQIGERVVGRGHPVYIVAELSANHGQDFDQALDLIKAAHDCGVDAVKLQTYTPDTITLNCRNQYFEIHGSLWEGKNLYDLYAEAYTPWEWQPKLKDAAEKLGLDLFSSPFDPTAVDFLEGMSVPAYKIASFEIVDLPLVRKIAKTGKPVIMSTGMATLEEIEEAMKAIHEEGNKQIALLKCTSAYPAPLEEMNLRTISDLADRFEVPVGLSDHTMGITAPIAAVTLGACIIEKHFTLSRQEKGPDSAFSLEPTEFTEMVKEIRAIEKALGAAHYGTTPSEEASKAHRRSLFAVKDVAAGQMFTEENVRSIRPGDGLHTRYIGEIIGRRAACDIKRGTPLAWSLIEGASGSGSAKQ